MENKNFGKYGGRVLRKFESGGKPYIVGAILTPEMVADWPTANKTALHSADKVEWFAQPDEDAAKIATSVDKKSLAPSAKEKTPNPEKSDGKGGEEIEKKSSRKRTPRKK